MTAQTPNPNSTSPANEGQGSSVANLKEVSSAVAKEVRAAKARRPMSTPTRRLETTQIPGFHLHWMKQENLPQAYAASYQHVLDGEVEINTRNVSIDSTMGATADLSDRVTVQFGGDTLYLMKLDEALYNEDMALVAKRNANILQQIFRGEQIAGAMGPNPGDSSNSYVKKDMTSFNRANRLRDEKPLFDRKYK